MSAADGPRDDAPRPSGVVFAPGPVEGTRRRGAALIAGGLVGFMVLAVVMAAVRPWGAAAPPVANEPDASASAPAETPGSVADLRRLAPAPGDPVLIDGLVQDELPSLGQTLAGLLVDRAGRWGVGVGGSGPRLIRDDPWSAWSAVAPVRAGEVPILPGHRPACDGAVALPDGARLVAITTPRGLVPDWRVLGWWFSDTDAVSLDPLVRQVSPPGNRGISYLERLDRQTWPNGRYEFHILSAGRILALTVCLGPS